MIFKVCLMVSLVGVALSFPADPYGPPVHPPKYIPHDVKIHAKPYSFSYGVQDSYAGTSFGQEEQSDGNLVKGTYSVLLPDGRKQTVNYKSDHETGYIADVQYYGDAQYPPLSDIPPFVVKHTYKPEHEPPKYQPHPPKYGRH